MAGLETRVYLVRHGVTDWHRDRRVLGARDISLNDEGRAQARVVADALAPLKIGELMTSPMARAVETAQIIATAQKLPLATDPRLAEISLGRWEGMTYDDVAAAPEYQRFVAEPLSEGIPGGERLTDVRDRATGAIRHLLAEAPAGDHVAIVTHAAVVRILLAHYLGMSLASYHLLKVAPGSVSVLGFKDDRAPPRVLAVNVCGSLADVA